VKKKSELDNPAQGVLPTVCKIRIFQDNSEMGTGQTA
jgi:hypothetical protein